MIQVDTSKVDLPEKGAAYNASDWVRDNLETAIKRHHRGDAELTYAAVREV
jgi:hypothetical protein